MIVAALLLLQSMAAGATSPCPAEQPKGAVVLVVDGLIQGCESSFEVKFDLPMLEALPKTVVKTENPWDPGMSTYEGVLLRDLVRFVNASGTVLSFTALNDYRTDIDVSDTQSINVILAYKRNGEFMPVRDKGPLFVVFPFSDDPSLAVEARYAQSIWQVARMTVK
jgi:hypothetical protein